ncbi:restriction endonuclease subunit S [uncultured Helicobacter sp.]|uniref:restriction endonuclease subunit S n=1 Tax=uncultured Helicobacter sp. TaxID=175537 RepID=UPI00374EEF6D
MTHLPQGWEWKTLENIAEIQIGKTPTRNNLDFFQGENIWLSIRDLKDKFISSSNEKISDEAIVKTNMKKVPKGTLLMSFKLTLGKTAFADCDLYTNEAIAAIFIKDKNVDKYFLDYALKFTNLDKYVDNAVKGKTLNKQKLKQIEIPLPPLKEQWRIAGILDLAFEKIDTSVELLKANLANLDELAQSVLDRAFNPLGDSIDSTESTQNPSTHDTQSPYPLPQHWEWKSLGEMCKILNGGTPDTKNPVFWDLNQSHEAQTDKSVVGVGGEVERGEGATSQFKPLHPLAKDIETKNDDCNSTPLSQDDNSPYPLPQHWEWKTLEEIASVIQSGFAINKSNEIPDGYIHLRTHNIATDGNLNFETLVKVKKELIKEQQSFIEEGDILFNNTNSTELVGKTALVTQNYNYAFSNHITKIKLFNQYSPKLVVFYFVLLLKNKYFERICHKWIGQSGINTDKLKQIQIPLPKDIKEQEQIAKHLDSTFERIKKLKELYNAQLQDYEELKQSLLTQAFSGKL